MIVCLFAMCIWWVLDNASGGLACMDYFRILNEHITVSHWISSIGICEWWMIFHLERWFVILFLWHDELNATDLLCCFPRLWQLSHCSQSLSLLFYFLPEVKCRFPGKQHPDYITGIIDKTLFVCECVRVWVAFFTGQHTVGKLITKQF